MEAEFKTLDTAKLEKDNDPPSQILNCHMKWQIH